MNTYRQLTKVEIQQLKAQHCNAEKWSDINVVDDFSAITIWHVYFSGEIKLGSFKQQFPLADGSKKHAGIYHTHIHNCTIDNNVYIAHIKNRIANYHIEENAFIENVDCISVEGVSSFGNGTKVALLDETGSRSILIFNKLSAQTAYFLTLCKYNPQAIEVLNQLIEKHIDKIRSSKGRIGKNATIINSGTLKNINIGNFAEINGAQALSDGTINSNESAISKIGFGVIAREFILATGAELSDQAQIERCFIGQGTILSKQFSAIDSVFFANCQGFHGEAVSIFAGPYTVTHHKSTLLIGGMFSFFNAGSGSNQSNHMYKLGPIHYGIVDRGSKMASDSYIPWPSRIGSFSVIMGKHKNKIDSSTFPFSYIIAEQNESTIIPGINLQSIGSFRDALKWPERDTRTDSNKQDIINFEMLNPYTIQQILQGISCLSLKKTTKSTNPSNKVNIKASSIDRGIQFYQMAITIYLGKCLIQRIQKKEKLSIDTEACDKWMDIAGWISPTNKINTLLAKLVKGEINSFESYVEEIKFINEFYSEDEWGFVSSLMKQNLEKETDLSNDDYKTILSKYTDAKQSLHKLLHTDAKKEFSDTMKLCYAIDQTEALKQAEFELLRGNENQQPFISRLQKELDDDCRIANKMIAAL